MKTRVYTKPDRAMRMTLRGLLAGAALVVAGVGMATAQAANPWTPSGQQPTARYPGDENQSGALYPGAATAPRDSRYAPLGLDAELSGARAGAAAVRPETPAAQASASTYPTVAPPPSPSVSPFAATGSSYAPVRPPQASAPYPLGTPQPAQTPQALAVPQAGQAAIAPIPGTPPYAVPSVPGGYGYLPGAAVTPLQPGVLPYAGYGAGLPWTGATSPWPYGVGTGLPYGAGAGWPYGAGTGLPYGAGTGWPGGFGTGWPGGFGTPWTGGLGTGWPMTGYSPFGFM